MSEQGPAPLRALVVDDEVPLLRLVSGYLERDGFRVQAAAWSRRLVSVCSPGRGEACGSPTRAARWRRGPRPSRPSPPPRKPSWQLASAEVTATQQALTR
jgi:CheY-like chemotaxis protein